MILSVTFNPSLDYVMTVPDFTEGVVNRSRGERLFPGGKGINVSIMLSRLGVENIMTGFTAGFTGEALEEMLEESGFCHDFIKLPSGNTRINVKIRSREESEVNGQGPVIPPECVEALIEKIRLLGKGDALVLAGTVPDSASGSAYGRILGIASEMGVLAAVDASGEALKNSLPYKPFLIKPNLRELGELTGKELKTRKDIILAAEEALELGAGNVLASMAGDGGLLLCQDGRAFECAAPKGAVISSVGAGDSMLAGYLAGVYKTGDVEAALKLGVAAGSATAFKEWLGEKDDVAALLDDPAAYGL